MAKHKNSGKTVLEILKDKLGRIKNAPLDEDSPSWDAILHLAWEEIEERADRKEPGFSTFKKLLEQKRFNK
jgi:hypothetical protein